MFNDQNDKQPERTPRPGLHGWRPNRFALVFFLVMLVLFASQFFRGNAPVVREISYSDFTRSIHPPRLRR